MTELEKKKRMLITEAEVYRQMLKLEIQNVRICTLKMKRRVTSMSALRPLIMAALPLATSLFFRRRRSSAFSWRRLGALALVGLQAFRAGRPLFGGRSRNNRRPEKTESEEYLAGRI